MITARIATTATQGLGRGDKIKGLDVHPGALRCFDHINVFFTVYYGYYEIREMRADTSRAPCTFSLAIETKKGQTRSGARDADMSRAPGMFLVSFF
jgi:hypothetical protein